MSQCNVPVFSMTSTKEHPLVKGGNMLFLKASTRKYPATNHNNKKRNKTPSRILTSMSMFTLSKKIRNNYKDSNPRLRRESRNHM